MEASEKKGVFLTTSHTYLFQLTWHMQCFATEGEQHVYRVLFGVYFYIEHQLGPKANAVDP